MDEKLSVRKNAIRALQDSGADGEEAVLAFARALSDEDTFMKNVAAISLRKIGPGAKAALPELTKRFAAEGDSRTAGEILKTLMSVGGTSRQVLDALVAKVAAGDGASWTVFKEMRPALRSFGARAVPPLIKLFGKGDVRKRISVMRALAVLGEDARPAESRFVAALSDPEDRIRTAALNGLSAMRLPPERLVPLLMRLVLDRELSVRLTVMYKLRDLKEKAAIAVPDLIRAWRKRDDGRFRDEIIDTLFKIAPDSPETMSLTLESLAYKGVRRNSISILLDRGVDSGDFVTALIPILQEKAASERDLAAKTLGRIGEKAAPASPELSLRLEDESSEVRRRAAWALGRIGPAASSCLPALRRALESGDPELEAEALRAIRKIEGR
jgi:HEAT repeat protein